MNRPPLLWLVSIRLGIHPARRGVLPYAPTRETEPKKINIKEKHHEKTARGFTIV